ncbi:MAG: hypothetical protein ACRELE_01610, partial [Gemmatimonadales bacterium]
MRSLLRAIALVTLLTFAGNTAAHGQVAAQVVVSTTPAPPSGRRITPLDMKHWNSIRQSALSNDGKWFAYVAGPPDGNVTVVVRGTAKDARDVRVAAGNGGGSLAISGDSRWLGYIVAPPKPVPGRGGRGGPGRAGA